MTVNKFYLDFCVTGSERERLVEAISTFTGADARALGAPTFDYEIDYFTIDRNGCVSFDDRADSEEIENLLGVLANQGFVSMVSNLGCEDEEEPEAEEAPEGCGLTVTMPVSLFDIDSQNNLYRILSSKGGLIRKALNLERLPVQVGEETISFPWFADKELSADEIRAYTHLISALCSMARTQKCVTAQAKEEENERYAFRCFLLRLGFIGPEYKAERKILLRNLSGSSAFKSGAHRPAAASESEVEA